jgi:hypothetical protein
VLKAHLRGQDRLDYIKSIMKWADLSQVQGSTREQLHALLELCAQRAANKGEPYVELYKRCKQLFRDHI